MRGGNTAAALAQFRPQMLSQEIANQYQRLGGLAGAGLSTGLNVAGLGQASAAGTAAGAQTAGSNISNALMSGGEAQAQHQIAKGAARMAPFQQLGGMANIALGYGLKEGKFDKYMGW